MTDTATETGTAAGERLDVGGDEATIRVTSAETAGALLAMDVRMSPGGGPPGLHRHAAEEVYRLDEGELALYVEDAGGVVRRVLASPRTVVHIPSGRAHTVRNESGADARAYVVWTPGSEIERFVRAVASYRADAPPSMDEAMALAGRHGIEPAGPIPAGL